MFKTISFALGLASFATASSSDSSDLFLAADAFDFTQEPQVVTDEIVSNSGKGFDISQAMSTSIASCLKSNGYTTALVRAYCSYGAVDSNACTSLNAAKAAGILNRDVYMFPCPTCSASPASQLASLISNLKNNCSSAWSTMIWLDIEGTQYWTGSTTSNRAWYQKLVDACNSTSGVRCGVYSSYY